LNPPEVGLFGNYSNNLGDSIGHFGNYLFIIIGSLVSILYFI